MCCTLSTLDRECPPVSLVHITIMELLPVGCADDLKVIHPLLSHYTLRTATVHK